MVRPAGWTRDPTPLADSFAASPRLWRNPTNDQHTAPRTSLALVLALILAFCAAATAFAGGSGQTVEVASQLKLRNSAPAFHGRVTADNPGCVASRTVKMFKQKRSGAKKLLGTATTDNDGKWTVPFENLESAAYFGVVTRSEEGAAGTIYVCLRAKSQVIAVD